jgi:hypothetical protein
MFTVLLPQKVYRVNQQSPRFWACSPSAWLVALPETWVLERVCQTFSGAPLAKSDTPLRVHATPRQCMRSHSETV